MYGKTEWLIADCYWPEVSTEGHYVSHEAICVLNAGDTDAELQITLYFEDAEPMEGFRAVCPARRTNHIRMDRLRGEAGEPVPRGKAYAALVRASVPVVVQYSRLDTTQPSEALMTTMAW